MKTSLSTAALAMILACASLPAGADTITSSTGTGGQGGAGGSAAGGSATGGSATGGSNSNNISGVGKGGTGGTASGGSASADGAYVGSVSTGGSSATLGDITVNLNTGSTTPLGKSGLGVGVDPTTGHVVTDTNITYQGSYKLKNTPDVNVGGPASGPCNGFSGGFGISMAGIALGGNTSTVDEGCSARETARIAAMIGRMDVANAILENLPIVQAAMKAKSQREAPALPPRSEAPATTAPAQLLPAPVPIQEPTEAQRQAALKEQQRLAQEALQRQATMGKLNDTLKFTDAASQGNDKTPQEQMAEEANKQLAAKAEETRKHQAIAASPPQAPPPPIQADSPPVFTPVALHTLKADSTPKSAEEKLPLQAKSVNAPEGSKISAKTDVSVKSAEERLKAAKAALNLQ